MPSVLVGRSNANVAAKEPKAPWWLRVGFWVCVAISIGVVIRRCIALARPSESGPPQPAALDAAFASHKFLTLAHILPALAFVVLVAVAYFRQKASERVDSILIPLGFVVALTAYAMSIFAIGGWIERSAVLFFNSLFLLSLIFALTRWRESDLRRRWITRAVGILLGIATTRPVMGFFFATSPITGWRPEQFFGIAFWIGFTINTVLVELWLRRLRPQAEAQI
jgi:hypothetical protein